uniref:Uncharacterized protein n=1 Tax=Caenorhabditis japonica TaxID=281687 RepID=A0A8R1EX15_CAEJA
MAMKSVAVLTKGMFGRTPAQLAVSSALPSNTIQKRSNYKYVGMPDDTDGTVAGDLNYGLHTVFFTELFR